jgi:enolase
MTHLYRILHKRGNGSAEFEVHTGRKGTSIYLSVGAARSAVTQFRKQDRYYGGGTIEYKIQTVELAEWKDIDVDDTEEG